MKYTLTIEGTPAELGNILSGKTPAPQAATTGKPGKTAPKKDDDDDVNFDIDDTPPESTDVETEPEHTLEDVRKALGKWAKSPKGSPEKAKKLLKKIADVDTLPEADAEHYPALMKAIGAAK